MSSIYGVFIIGFSARHDKRLPASSLVAVKDKTLLVVFKSLEVCNIINVDVNYTLQLYTIIVNTSLC